MTIRMVPNFSDLFKQDSFTYNAGAGFNWDIFNYGRITNNVRVEDARFQELAVNYEDTVIRAAQEVEDAMVGFLQSQNAVVFPGRCRQSLQTVRGPVPDPVPEGVVDYQRVLDTQRDLTTQQDNLVFTAGSVGLNLVAMYRALGGGWEIRGENDFIPASIKEEMQTRTNWGDMLSPNETEYPPSQDVKKIFHRPDW